MDSGLLKNSTIQAGQFMSAIRENTTSLQDNKAVFDSAKTTEFISQISNRNNTGVKLPEKLGVLFDELQAHEQTRVIRAFLDGANEYQARNGAPVPADVVEQAIHLAYSTSKYVKNKYYDDSSTNHHDPLSLQTNRTIVSILAMMSTGIPYAHFLPADIGSNEARLAIMTHRTGLKTGEYDAKSLLDGSYSGGRYVSSARVHTVKGGGTMNGKVTAIQTSADTCDQTAPAVKFLRGRALVYVNGVPAGREIAGSTTGAASVAGSVNIAGTDYAITGTFNPDTGEFNLSSNPTLPTTVKVSVESFIDFETQQELVPTIISEVNTYSLFANPWRVLSRQTIDSRTQMSNELGLDPYGEGILAIQAQFENERHYDVLAKAIRLADNNSTTYAFDYANRKGALIRSEMWQDFSSTLSELSQQMAVDTMNHGITHLVVGKLLASELMGLNRDIFEPSGISERPCIYRLGRFMGQYEVYYSPKVVTETQTSAKMLCIGKGTDVTRNPFVLGDAVAPTTIPLSVNADLNTGVGFYARNFTCVNPHAPSARGCAVIDITGIRA